MAALPVVPEPGFNRALFVRDVFTNVKRGGLVNIASCGARYRAREVESELSEGDGEPMDSLNGHRGQQALKG